MMLLTILRSLVDAEATAADRRRPHERTPGRTTQRNGTSDKIVSTTTGDLTMKIPKLRAGSFFSSLLESGRWIERRAARSGHAGLGRGRSTRSVNDLVAALGVDAGISESEVPRICNQFDGKTLRRLPAPDS